MFSFAAYMHERRIKVDRLLREKMPSADTRPAKLHAAMRYSVLSGGKRLRPIVCLAVAEALGDDSKNALLPAAALELLHTYTLIHDDLPALDNDTLRRGKPTCHVVFGEAVALLAGDALLTLAFEWMAGAPIPEPYDPARLVLELTQASGSSGVLAGQAEDVASQAATPDMGLLSYIHEHKTATLFRAAARIGALAVGADEKMVDLAGRYGTAIGRAYQVIDDIVDAASGGTEADKLTAVSLLGRGGATSEAHNFIQEALGCARQFSRNVEPLVHFANFIIERAQAV